MKIAKNKTGTIFLITMLALAGIGISYAGWTDTIQITGSADTGTVSWEVIEYSGTWVWKHYDDGTGNQLHEKIVHEGPVADTDLDDNGVLDDDSDPDAAYYYAHPEEYKLVSSSWAQEGTNDEDVNVYFDNLFPCTWFKADIIIKYTGSIPGRINDITYKYISNGEGNWLYDLIESGDIYATARCNGEVVDLGYQLHENDEITIELWIHLPQQQDLQLRSGGFTASFEVVQWSEYPDDGDSECGNDVDLTLNKEVDNSEPYVGDQIEYTITASNNGPETAKNVYVMDYEPDGLTFLSASSATGVINLVDGQVIWDIGEMLSADTATATITANVDSTAEEEIENCCEITSTSEETNPADNTVCVTINPIPLSQKQLVGHWKLDDATGDTATDSSGNSNDGILMPNSPVWTSDGVINGALYFDGIDDYVEIPDDPSLDITDEITLMAWVYPENWDNDDWTTDDGTAENAIITKAEDGDVGVWNLHYKTNAKGFRFELNGGDNNEDYGINIYEEMPSTELNNWYHVAGTYDGSQVKLYINGEMVSSEPYTHLIDTNEAPLRFGKQFYWSTIYSMWNGKIDDVKIYSRALSDTEIENEYTQNCPDLTTITINNPGPQYDNNQYGYDFDYSSANVEFTYCYEDSNLRGTIEASGLKPYCTYQVKLIGKPTCQYPTTGDDMANEYIGYKGRWTCTDCGCTGAACNRNDAQYLANSDFSGEGSECIAGYLVFEFFTADENGEATKQIEAETSYHVLFAGGGTCNVNNNDYLYYPDTSHPSLAFCPPDKVNGQPEAGRGGCGGLTLDADKYHCTIALTEESFHQGNWATVLEGTIDFEII